MAATSSKKVKLDALPTCPYGSKCYRKNPAHLEEFSHTDLSSVESKKELPICPFGATCYRKNLLHFAEYKHPFDLLNPDAESSDDEEKKITDENEKKRKLVEDHDSDKTEEYDSDDESMYDIKLEKTFSKMTDDEKRLMIEQAFALKDKLQEKLKKSREEAEQIKKDIEQLQTKISEGVLLMEGEEEVLKGTKIKYFELFPERNYKRGSAADVHFRLAESQFYRLMTGYEGARVSKVEYVCNPKSIERFTKAREELKAKRGEAYSYPVLAFHGTDVKNIIPICENGFKVPGEDGFKHATDTGYYGRGAYFSEYPGFSMGYIKGATKLLLCQILQGKVFHCTDLIVGADLKTGYDSHCSPTKQELIIFRSDYILPQYIVHYSTTTGEFTYSNPVTKEELKKKLANIGKLYKKAVKTNDTNVFNHYKFQLIGQMADTPIAMEKLIKRFGGTVCKNAIASGLVVNNYPMIFDYPNVIICSVAEMESTTPSIELQTFKNQNYQAFHREDFLYDSILAGAMQPLNDYLFD